MMHPVEYCIVFRNTTTRRNFETPAIVTAKFDFATAKTQFSMNHEATTAT